MNVKNQATAKTRSWTRSEQLTNGRRECQLGLVAPRDPESSVPTYSHTEMALSRRNRANDKIAALFPEQTWKENEYGLPDSECAICRGKEFWQSRFKKYTCATCHPPPHTKLVREWVELDSDPPYSEFEPT